VSSDPADGVTLATAPAQVLLTFSEPPDLSLSTFDMLDATGAEVELADPELSDGQSGREVMLMPSAPLADGVYTVTFRVVSKTDGHLTAGSIAFGVGTVTGEVVPTASAPREAPWPSALSVIGKTLLYIGLVMLVAAAAVGMGAFAGEVPGRRVLLPAAGVTALVGACVMLIAEARSVGAGLGTITRSDAGEPFLRLIAVCAVVAVTATIAALRGDRVWLVVAGDAAAAAMLVRATGGHAGAQPLQVVVQWIHFMVVAVWVGGFTLLLMLLRARRGADAPVAEARSYSRLAGLALLVVVASGLVRAFYELGGWSAIRDVLDTSYGTTLVIKVAIVLGLVALGAVNRTRAIPKLEDGSPMLSRLVGVEAVTAVVILAVTATLTGLSPHAQPARRASGPPAAPASVTVEGSDFATTMRVQLIVTPGTPGPNDYEVHVVDYDTGEPIPADSVSLRFEAVGRPEVEAATVELATMMDDHWAGRGAELSLPGPWIVTASITAGAEATEVPMTLSIAAPDQQVHVTEQSGEPTIYMVTAADGRELQYYADPGTVGPNQLHLTAFDAAGQELPLDNETWAKVDRPGVYFGQCSELCGARHAYMPIAIEVVPPAQFAQWIASKGGHMKGTAPPAPDSTAVSPVSASNVAAPAAQPQSAARIGQCHTTTRDQPGRDRPELGSGTPIHEHHRRRPEPQAARGA
jgi:copper transport protein